MIALKIQSKIEAFFSMVDFFFPSKFATLPYAGFSPLRARSNGYQGQGEVWG